MHRITLTEKDTINPTLEKRRLNTVNQIRVYIGLKFREHFAPVLGLIFLRFAEVRFSAQRAKLEKASASSRRGSRLRCEEIIISITT